jgi:hypothetical protein
LAGSGGDGSEDVALDGLLLDLDVDLVVGSPLQELGVLSSLLTFFRS